jgi:superoxide dismutase, Cu-Zn family
LKRAIVLFLALVSSGLLAGLTVSSVSAQTPTATAEIKNAQGQTVGNATFTAQGSGVQVSGTVRNLPAGQHGIHIHDVGQCVPADFASAGGHFNPEGKQHGLQNPQGAHAGDLPNLVVAADGTGTISATATRAALGTGTNQLGKSGGTALVIHADADDEKTDPTGNSGGRIACGVIVMAQAGGGAGSSVGSLPSTGTGTGIANSTGTAGLLVLFGVIAVVGGSLALRRQRMPRA